MNCSAHKRVTRVISRLSHYRIVGLLPLIADARLDPGGARHGLAFYGLPSLSIGGQPYESACRTKVQALDVWW